MKHRLFFFLLFISQLTSAQNANDILKKSYQQFNQLKTYTSDVQFLFDIPTVNIKNVKGKAYYKTPNKYRVKLEGIAFVPNENPMKIYSILADPSQYQALTNTTETIQNQKCHIINIIPHQATDFILGKLWINTTNFCPLKIEFTTSKGTILIENYFKTITKYGLPDKSIFYLPNFKPRKEKGLGGKKEEKQDDKKASITLLYSSYQINVPVADSLFKKVETKATK